MRTWTTAALLVGAMAVASVGAAAQTATHGKTGGSSTATHTKSTSDAKMADHTTSGTVKSVTDSSLVVDRGSKKGEMTFALNNTTHKQGTIATGSHVTVHYRTEGTTEVATAVTAEPAHTSKSTKK